MAKLLEKKLAGLQPGTHLELIYGTPEKTIRGKIEDSDFEESFEIRESDGNSVFLMFNIIRSFRILDSDGENKEENEESKENKNKAGDENKNVIPGRKAFFETTIEIAAASDAALKQQFDVLCKPLKTTLNGFFDSCLYGMKNSDANKAQQACRNLVNAVANSEYHNDPAAVLLCANLLLRTKQDAGEMFLKGRHYLKAALCMYKTGKYAEAGACALAELLQNALSEEQDLLYSVILHACEKEQDITGVKEFRQRSRIKASRHMTELLTCLTRNLGMTPAADDDGMVAQLSAVWKNEQMGTCLCNLLEEPPEEEKPEEELAGQIVKLGWISEQGTIGYADGTCTFRYTDIVDPELEKRLRGFRSSDMGGEYVAVRFVRKGERAVQVRAGVSMLPEGRAISLQFYNPDRYTEALPYLEQALHFREDVAGAMDQLMANALAYFRSRGKTDLAERVLEMYPKYSNLCPNTWQHLDRLIQLYRMLDNFKMVEHYLEKTFTCPMNPHQIIERSMMAARIYAERYDQTGNRDCLRAALRYCGKVESTYESMEAAEQTSNETGYYRSGLYAAFIEYECKLEMLDEARLHLKKLISINPAHEQLHTLRSTVHRLEQQLAPAQSEPENEETMTETAQETVETEPTAQPTESEEKAGQSEPAVVSGVPEPRHDADESDPLPENYEDTDGWEALNLSKQDVGDYALSIRGEGRLAAMLTYLRAGASLCPALEPLYHTAALAADDPVCPVTYNVDAMLAALAQTDSDYDRFTELCMAAGSLRTAFVSNAPYDYTADTLKNSVPVFLQMPALGEAFDTMMNFRKWYKRSMDSCAVYRRMDSICLQKKLDETVSRAKDLYEHYILTPPREDASFARFVETKKIVFARDGELARLLKLVGERNQEELENCRAGFLATWTDQKEISEASVSENAVNRLIDDSWNKAMEVLIGQHRTMDLQGNRRRNLRSNIFSILDNILQWYRLTAHGLSASPENDPALDEYERIRPSLTGLLEQVQEECVRMCGEKEADSQQEAGYFLLKTAAQDLCSRLDGSWNEELRRYLFADFLRSDWVMLDENLIPDISSTFCALPDFNILARIRHHVEERTTLEEHLKRIYSNDPTANNYGVADQIVQYLSVVQPDMVPELPEQSRRYVTQSEKRSVMELNRFRADYAMSISRGQIIQSDPFLTSMESTVRYWHDVCCNSRNFGFFHSLSVQCYDRIHQSAAQYEERLYKRLDALLQNNADMIRSIPEDVEGTIRSLIQEQNFTVAEDWMNRILRRDFNNKLETPEALEYLNQFLRDYSMNFEQAGNAGVSLRSRLHTFVRNRDQKGGQKLVENWPSSGTRSSSDQIQRLLTLLGWANIKVEPVNPVVDSSEVYHVSELNRYTGKRNILHPVAAFGSDVAGVGFNVVCLFGTYDCDRLLEKFKALDYIRGHKIVLIDASLTLPERRKLAHKIKKKEAGLATSYLVLDRVLMCHLVNNYNGGHINKMLMALGMPFAYYQPYVYSSSDRMPPEMFIGRKDELLKIEDPNGVNLVYGGRQLGKSALLKKARADLDGSQQQRAVLVDLPGCGCRQAAFKISHELFELGILPQSAVTEDWAELARSLKTRLRNQEEPISYLLLLLDEADMFIGDCATFNYQPMAELKDVQQSLPGQFKFVLAGLHNIVRFNREVALGQNSVITHLPSLNVKPFQSAEAQELLLQPMSYLGFRLENPVVVSEILATANYFPGLIQLYGQKLIESMRAADYAGYTEADTPPYVITSNHLRRVLADNDFVYEIRDKFEITLRLDSDQGSYYYLIALLIAWLCYTSPSSIGYSADDLMHHAKDLSISSLERLEHSQMDTLLQELLDLNILSSTGTDTYFFASKHFQDLLGSETQVFEKLLKLGGTQ